MQRLGTLLRHRVRVRSRPGKGFVFMVEVALAPDMGISGVDGEKAGVSQAPQAPRSDTHTGTILVIENE